MASPPPPPRSTRSRPSLPPSGIPSTSSSSSSHPDRQSSPKSANAIAHAMYTESLSGLGKKDRTGRATSRKKSSGELGAERMLDQDTEEAASTPKSRPSDSDSIAGQSVKDEELDPSRPLADPVRAQQDGDGEGSAQDRPPPPALVVTANSPEDVDMDNQEPSADPDKQEDEEDEEEDESDEDGADVTRCVCGITESDDMMIQCDTCNVWQHGACVGIPTEEETPDEYFCEKCRPDLHVALKKWMRSMSRGRGGIFLPPSANDLHRLSADDNLPPNQSKRWTHDLPNMPPITGGHDSDSDTDRGGRGRRSRSNRTKPASTTSNGHPPTAAGASSSASGSASASHRPLAFPPRKTATGSAPNGAAGPSSTASSSSHPPPTTSSSSRPPVSKSHKRQVSGSSNHHGLTHRQLSPIAPSSSQSPPPTKPLKSPKKRSTMNSRDAGLEEAIRESLLAAGGTLDDDKPGSSRRSASSNGSQRDKDEHEEKRSTAGSKRGRRMSVESSVAGGDAGSSKPAPAPSKKKKAKKETLVVDPSIPTSPSHSHANLSPNSKNMPYDEHHPSHPHHHGKAKHPNQYTYRPKTSPSTAAFPPPTSSHHAPAASTSTAKEGPSPSKPPKEKASSHAALSSAAHDHGTRRNGPSSNGKGSGGTHSHGQRGEGGTGNSTPTWGIPDHLSHLAHLLPSAAPRPLLIGVNPPHNAKASSSFSASQPKPFTTGPREEPPTRIKWPAKRMTIGEMRKRVRGVLDFVGRWPVGDEREGPPPPVLEGEESNGEPVRGKTRAEEVEELVRDLIAFEARYGIAIPSSGLRSGDLGGNLRSGTPTSVVVEEEEETAAEEAAEPEEDAAMEGVEGGEGVVDVDSAPAVALAV